MRITTDRAQKNGANNAIFLRYFLCFLAIILASSCTWDSKDRDDTLAHFRDNVADYEALLRSVEGNPNFDVSTYKSVFPEGIEVIPLKPPIVEITPINFYYVIVYARDKESLNASNAMKDEGRALKDLGNGWHLVQRGFN